MNDHLKNLKHAPGYSLTERERTDMRTALEHLTRETTYASMRPASSAWFLFLARPFPLSAVALLLIVSTGGVSFAAAGALPGDLLYPVKIGMNEPVVLALAPSIEAKADVRVRQAEERLRETEVLAARGNLTYEIADATAAAVAVSIDDAAQKAKALRDDGDASAAAGIHARIASALDAHAELLGAQAENFSDASGESLRALSLTVASAAASAALPQDSGDLDEGAARLSAESAHARAKTQLEALGDRLADEGVPEETEAELASEFARLSAEFEDTGVGLASNDYVSASRSYEDVSRRAYRLLTLLRAAQEIGDESDKEVVITLATLAPAPVLAARTKSAAADVMTLSLMVEATTSDEVSEEDTAQALLREASEPSIFVPTLQFRLRTQGGE